MNVFGLVVMRKKKYDQMVASMEREIERRQTLLDSEREYHNRHLTTLLGNKAALEAASRRK